MRSKRIKLTNFSRNHYSESPCLRPENEDELKPFLAHDKAYQSLARGAGLSYNDSCLNRDKLIINTSRLNHLIEFDSQSQQLICQANVSFRDLFLVHPEFIPPVIPGTLDATIGGGIAHDIHGKNNPGEGSLCHHVMWLELLIGSHSYHCSREQHADLFYATVGGLGLTGVITRVALRLKRASRVVQVNHMKFQSLNALLATMATKGLKYDYQVAWLDLINKSPRARLTLANHSSAVVSKKHKTVYTLPRQPFTLINKWNIALFNHFYFNSNSTECFMPLEQFNNPLDQIKGWNTLYGNKGLIQFQALLPQDNAQQIIDELRHLMKHHKAIPTLAVLKLFTHAGEGLLSFCQAGFTLAIDFVFNDYAKDCVAAMNQFIMQHSGRVYLAKDLLLTPEQYQIMYPNIQKWRNTVQKYQCMMHSDLSTRLGIMP